MVMQSPVPETHSEKQWKVTRLTMHSAFKDCNPSPQVKDPKDILAFLDHHFDLAIIGHGNQDGPIQNGLCALASASATTEAFNQFDPTEQWFVRGICYAFQSDRSSELHEAALLFLPLIGNRWFHPQTPIMGSIEMASFCVDWASTVDCLNSTSTIKKAALIVLLGMINSPHWFPHIVPAKWNLLEYFLEHFKSVSHDLQFLSGCINNIGLLDKISNVDNPMAVVLWVEILWLEYVELIPEVRKQLEAVTKEIAQNEISAHLSASQSHLDKYLLNISRKLREAEDALKQYTPPFTDPAAVTLRNRVKVLRQAFQILDTIQPSRVPLVSAGG